MRDIRPASLAAIATGVVTCLCASYGLYLCAKSLYRAITGDFDARLSQWGLHNFYTPFFVMLSIATACCLVLLWCGVDQIRLRLAHLKLFAVLFIFEVLYVFFIGYLWTVKSIGLDIGAATGVANRGLWAPWFIALPLWAPFVLFWARKRLRSDRAF
jgi:hypothetical protein